MTVERELISRVVARPEDLSLALNQGVSAQHFHDPDLADAWAYIVEFRGDYGKAPSADAIRLEYGDFRFAKPADPTQHYIDQLFDDHRRIAIKELLQEAVGLIKGGDHEAALQLMQTGVLEIEQSTSLTEDSTTADVGEILARLKALEEKGDELMGVPTGFPFIDGATGGWKPEQLVIVAGPQKAGKSSILMKMALAAQEADYKVLFISFEMSNQEQLDRYLSLASGVSKFAMTHGKLTKADWSKLRAGAARVERMVPLTWVHDVRRTTTVAAIEAKVDQYKPDIVFIDGVYMMDSGVVGKTQRDWEALAVLTSGLKRMAQNLKLTVVGSTQALENKYTKSQGIKSSAIGYSSTFQQDADIVIGLEKPEGTSNRAPLRIMDARDAGRGDTQVAIDWDTGTVEQYDEWSDDNDNYNLGE